jgi:hypothetical protein
MKVKFADLKHGYSKLESDVKCERMHYDALYKRYEELRNRGFWARLFNRKFND